MFAGRLYAGRLYAGQLYHRGAAPAPQPETPPTFSGGGSRPQRDARKPRNDDDELLIMVLL